MTTTSDIIARSLDLIGVTAASEVPSAQDASDALDALNMMMHSWELSGVNVSHSDLSLSDAFPLAAKYHEAVVYLLGARLAGIFMRPMPDPVKVDDSWRRLQAGYWTAPTTTFDTGLIDLPSQYRDGNYRVLS